MRDAECGLLPDGRNSDRYRLPGGVHYDVCVSVALIDAFPTAGFNGYVAIDGVVLR